MRSGTLSRTSLLMGCAENNPFISLEVLRRFQGGLPVDDDGLDRLRHAVRLLVPPDGPPHRDAEAAAVDRRLRLVQELDVVLPVAARDDDLRPAGDARHPAQVLLVAGELD